MATDYSLDLKASLDTAEVQEKLNDLSFKGKHATSDLEVAVKRLDNAVQEWEKYLIEMKDEAKQDKAGRPNPNFTGKDALRTSPGQLLPGEIHSSKRNDFQ